MRKIPEYAGLILHAKLYHEKTPVFIVGCQRSGTTMLLNVLERTAECYVYDEGDKEVVDKYYRIRSDTTIKRLIKKNNKMVIVFKPLNDSQNIDRLLTLHQNAKAIFTYRHYHDVINSAVNKWGDAQKTIMLSISRGYIKDPGVGAIRERMTEKALAVVRNVCSEHMSAEDGAALLWYVRNSIYFDLNLNSDNRVLLVKYEDLVTRPEQHFMRIYNFIGCTFSMEYANDVNSSSIRKHSPGIVDDKIESLCKEMMYKLNGQYDQQTLQQYSL